MKTLIAPPPVLLFVVRDHTRRGGYRIASSGKRCLYSLLATCSQSKVGARHRTIAREHVGLALADDASERQQIGAIGHGERAAGILLDHEDAHTVSDARERREQLAGQARRQPER